MTTSGSDDAKDVLGWDDSLAELEVSEVVALIASKLTGDPDADSTMLTHEWLRFSRHPLHRELDPLFSRMLLDACGQKIERKERVRRQRKDEMGLFGATMPASNAETRVNAPVFSLLYEQRVRYPNGDVLMGMDITRPVEDAAGRIVDRTYIDTYPVLPSDGTGVYHWDPEGDLALGYGADYYCEGMDYVDPEDRETRIDCFRAAEVLYRHALARGNDLAYLNLGYLYSYDRCEGHYWDGFRRCLEGLPEAPFPRERRAFECFREAAEAGYGEGWYKLGDLHRLGIGCEPDAEEALFCYTNALGMVDPEDAPVVGSLALRFGECYEEGFGCEQSFRIALDWYERAAATLEKAVEVGATWYERALFRARAGVKRCKQEL